MRSILFIGSTDFPMVSFGFHPSIGFLSLDCVLRSNRVPGQFNEFSRSYCYFSLDQASWTKSCSSIENHANHETNTIWLCWLVFKRFQEDLVPPESPQICSISLDMVKARSPSWAVDRLQFTSHEEFLSTIFGYSTIHILPNHVFSLRCFPTRRRLELNCSNQKLLGADSSQPQVCKLIRFPWLPKPNTCKEVFAFESSQQ